MVHKMKGGFLLMAVLALPLPAHAQAKKVVTINPDGSVTVTNPDGKAENYPAPKNMQRRGPPFMDALPPEERRKAANPPPVAAEQKAEEPAAPSVPETVHKDPVAPKKPAAPKKEAAPKKPAAKKPVMESVEKPATAKPEKKAAKKPAKPKAQKPAEPEIHKGEPAAADSMGRSDPRAKTEARKPGPVSPEEAKRIAIDVGPPARGVDVFPADYNGRKVFQVVFLTEEGERYVLVDRASGEIVRD